MRSFFSAFRFLTILPVPERWCGGERELARSVVFYPVVGLAIGLVAAGLDVGLSRLLPPFPSSVLLVIFLILVSGGLHMDGLADTADGFLSSRPRERILEIMRDSRTGAMGVMAIVCVVALKIALFSGIPSGLRWPIVLLTPLAGRCAMLIVMSTLPYAREGGGLCTTFQTGRTFLHARMWAALFLLAAGWIGLRQFGFGIALLAIAVAFLWGGYCRRRIGGMTGDTLGAACEIGELGRSCRRRSGAT